MPHPISSHWDWDLMIVVIIEVIKLTAILPQPLCDPSSVAGFIILLKIAITLWREQLHERVCMTTEAGLNIRWHSDVHLHVSAVPTYPNRTVLKPFLFRHYLLTTFYDINLDLLTRQPFSAVQWSSLDGHWKAAGDISYSWILTW